MPDLERLLREARDRGASDLHLSAGLPPLLRIDGRILRLDERALEADEAELLVLSLLTEAQGEELRRRHDLDLAREVPGLGRFRVNAYSHLRGLGAAVRAVPSRVPDLDELGLPAVLGSLCERERGLVLVTGPTGSGKSTTLAALVDRINRTRLGHVLTLEDPIELVHEPRLCLVTQREVGTHAASFAEALRSGLREDPDVILVGELRDLETIALALTAAETGHLVLSTLHALSAPKTIDRVLDVFPGEQQPQVRAMLAESLLAVVAQALLPRVGGGRVAAVEILLGTPAMRALIREGKLHQAVSVMQASRRAGMQTMDAALAELVALGLVAADLPPPSA